MDYTNSWIHRHIWNRITVAITSRCSENNLQWLKDFITEEFLDHSLDVKYLPITNTNRNTWEDEVNKCSVVILYHTRHQGPINISDIDEGIYNEELSYLFHKLGREKILVLLDDMEDTSEKERQGILNTQPSLSRLSFQLILIPENGKYKAAYIQRGEFLQLLGPGQTTSCPDRNLQNQNSSGSKSIDDTFVGNGISTSFVTTRPAKNTSLYEEHSHLALTKCTVGIFSRAGVDNYQWLVSSLQTANTGRSIDVRSVYISNKNRLFYSEMSQCNFCILYHTKKQGRLNITDVTDSLYDQELREMSECLGKKYVIVVVDDIKDTSPAERDRILKNQPSIKSLAEDLFLFSEQHKDQEKLQTIIKLIKRNVPGNETNNIKSSHPSTSWYIGAQEDERQHDDEFFHLSGSTSYKPPSSPTLDIYTSRKRHNHTLHDHDYESLISMENSSEEQESKKILIDGINTLDDNQNCHNHSLLGHGHESSSKKTSCAEQESKNNSLKDIAIFDDTADMTHSMDSQLTVLNDTCSVFFARLSEFNDTWRRFQKAKQNPQSEIQLLHKTRRQEAELNEKDNVIYNLNKNLEEKQEEVHIIQSKLQDKQKTIEEKDKFIEGLMECRDKPIDEIQEQGRENQEHSTETLNEIIQEQKKVIQQFYDEIQNLEEKLHDQQDTEELGEPLRKRRGAKKWAGENIKGEQDGRLDASLTRPETMENCSMLEDSEDKDDKPLNRHKLSRLWHRIIELESRIKQLEYTTDFQKYELEKYRQTVKEQSSQINEYKAMLDTLVDKTEGITKM